MTLTPATATGTGMTDEQIRATKKVLDDVLSERMRQILDKGFDIEDDDQHSTDEWLTLLSRYILLAAGAAGAADGPRYRHRLVQIAAVSAAAMESYDRVLSATVAR